jgi:hypothetical protein
MARNKHITVTDIVEKAGGSLAVAMELGVSQISVWRWQKTNHIPKIEYLEPLRLLANIPKEEIYDLAVLPKSNGK